MNFFVWRGSLSHLKLDFFYDLFGGRGNSFLLAISLGNVVVSSTQNSYKPSQDLWEATLERRTTWVQRDPSVQTNKQLSCYFIIRISLVCLPELDVVVWTYFAFLDPNFSAYQQSLYKANMITVCLSVA